MIKGLILVGGIIICFIEAYLYGYDEGFKDGMDLEKEESMYEFLKSLKGE